MEEATAVSKQGLDVARRAGDWFNIAVAAGNLSELQLCMGKIGAAIEYARESVSAAERGDDWFQHMNKRTTWADAFHQSGQIEKAARLFEQAETLQKSNDPAHRWLYSVQGYQYCELLLGQVGLGVSLIEGAPRLTGGALDDAFEVCWQVGERARRALQVAQARDGAPLDVALSHLAAGQALLCKLALQDPGSVSLELSDDVLSHIDQAVDGVRVARTQHHLPRAHLVRASARRLAGDIDRAEVDLEDAREAALRAGMKLLGIDVWIESACLNMARARQTRQGAFVTAARSELAEISRLLREIGYHRRDPELFALSSLVNGVVDT